MVRIKKKERIAAGMKFRTYDNIFGEEDKVLIISVTEETVFYRSKLAFFGYTSSLFSERRKDFVKSIVHRIN